MTKRKATIQKIVSVTQNAEQLPIKYTLVYHKYYKISTD